LFGKALHAVAIDFQSLTVDYAPLAGEVAIVVCDSGVQHALAEGEYNKLRRLCESAAKKLGANSLRSVELAWLTGKPTRLTGREYQCAYHVIGEIRRVALAERALRAADYAHFGQYMFQSHESSRDFFKNSTPELDLLVERARQHSSCLGARLTGGGFGGATINLVQQSELNNFIDHMARQYKKQRGRPLKPMICQIVDGAA